MHRAGGGAHAGAGGGASRGPPVPGRQQGYDSEAEAEGAWQAPAALAAVVPAALLTWAARDEPAPTTLTALAAIVRAAPSSPAKSLCEGRLRGEGILRPSAGRSPLRCRTVLWFRGRTAGRGSQAFAGMTRITFPVGGKY